MTTFNPEEFLDATFTDANSTTFEPIPANEYQATIEEIKFSNGTSQKTGEPWHRLEITWSIEDESLKELLNRKKLISRQSILLEMNESGGLAAGRGQNIGFGRLREAVDLNRPGEPFSPRMLIGRRALVKVSHEEYQGVTRDKVTGVAKLS